MSKIIDAKTTAWTRPEVVRLGKMQDVAGAASPVVQSTTQKANGSS